MKIGIMGTRGIPNHYGGFEQFAEQLSAGLVERGHEVYVYNSSLHPYQEKNWNGVHIIHCRDLEHKLGTAGQFIYDLNCINDSRKRKFDILLHLGYTSDSIWYWRWPKHTIHVVNMDGLEWQRSKYNGPTRRFLKWAESLAANNGNILVADSPGIHDHLVATYRKRPVYIPYGTTPFTSPDASTLMRYGLQPHEYRLLIARMEPENNIEMIIRGHLEAGTRQVLFVVGNIRNGYGQYITSKYRDDKVVYSTAIYDKQQLDNLRYFSSLYFHGHSVGGTNPSLLEAMACQCRIAAHNNPFNKAVLQQEADFFEDPSGVAAIIHAPKDNRQTQEWQRINLEKIHTIYSNERIIDSYEKLMLRLCGDKAIAIQQPVAEAV